MPQVRAILGHVSVETARGKRICSRHRTGKERHDIQKGELCLVVRGVPSDLNYCVDSARDVLERAESDLISLRGLLEGGARLTPHGD